jgi:hypothetical protein
LVRPFGLIDRIRIPIGRAIREIGNAEAWGLWAVVALAPEWGAHHVIP